MKLAFTTARYRICTALNSTLEWRALFLLFDSWIVLGVLALKRCTDATSDQLDVDCKYVYI